MSASLKSDNTEHYNNSVMTESGDVKSLEPLNSSTVLPDGRTQNCNAKQTAKDFDGEHCERKKKTRRGKPKRKKPYNKEISESRVKNYLKNRANNCSRFRNRQPVAPYNTNQFLMEDHTDLQELDERIQETAKKVIEAHTSSNSANLYRPSRARDSSFTSADSDEDYFYSSPEDEEEFLTKEFSNAYQDIHAESLQNMSKPELIQHVLHLETKIDILEQRLGSQNESDTKEDIDDKKTVDKTAADYEKEIEKLKSLNDQLISENEQLQRQTRSSSVSSVDSESDSSSSSGSSVSSVSDSVADDRENVDKVTESNLSNGLIPQVVCNMESEDIT